MIKGKPSSKWFEQELEGKARKLTECPPANPRKPNGLCYFQYGCVVKAIKFSYFQT